MPVFSIDQNKDFVDSIMGTDFIAPKAAKIPSVDTKKTTHTDSLESRSGWIITGNFYFIFARTQEKQAMIGEKQNKGLVFK